jgi:hypothetical protein
LVVLLLILLGMGGIGGLFALRYYTPTPVTFADLSNRPEDYVNTLIEVRGAQGLKGLCDDPLRPVDAPKTDAVLYADQPGTDGYKQASVRIEIQDSNGLTDYRRLGFPATSYRVVQGWFRRYDGLVGCGEREATVWYIEATAIRVIDDR